MRSDMVDIAGCTFGRLTVVNVIPKTHYCICNCSCGSLGRRIKRSKLKSGDSMSCGCLRAEMARSAMTTHGQTRTPEFRAWTGMLSRCYNPNTKGYERWGGRGISVCAEWRDDFCAFLASVGKRPGAGYSLDRFPDNNGNYEPGNVRWATLKQQQRNRNCNRLMTYRGESLCVSEWAERTGIPGSSMRAQLAKGISAEQMFERYAGRGHLIR